MSNVKCQLFSKVIFLLSAILIGSLGSISNFATGSFKFLFALIQTFSKVFNSEATGWEDHLVSFYTLIIACQGHISGVTVIFEFSNGCLWNFFTNLTILAILKKWWFLWIWWFTWIWWCWWIMWLYWILFFSGDF